MVKYYTDSIFFVFFSFGVFDALVSVSSAAPPRNYLGDASVFRN